MTSAIGVFIFMLLIGTPIAVVMVMSGLAGAMEFGGTNFLGIIAERMFSGVTSYLLMAIPYFVFTAELMNRAGLTERLIERIVFRRPRIFGVPNHGSSFVKKECTLTCGG